MFRRNTTHIQGRKRGFTLVELLVTIGVIAVTWFVIIGVFRSGFLSLANSRARVVALQIANDQLEIIRNLPYDSVGTTTGWPTGTLPSSQQVTRSGQTFSVELRVDYVDDPFDGDLLGTVVGKPVDTAPNDFKRAQATVTWNQATGSPVRISTFIVPRGVEAATNTGSLIIRVFDASGVGVPQATVRVRNTTVTPNVDITNTTDNFGNLQVIGLPPASDYNVVVSKTGYSTEQTYSTATYPNPVRPNLSVIVNQVTQTSFAIDRVSTLNISTQGENCSPIASVPLSLWGQKLIATSPDVLKFSSSPPTNASGQLSLTNLEWDNYTLIETSPAYDIAGVIPPILLNMLPNTTQSIGLLLAPATPNSLHVTVKDATNGTTVTGASVRLTQGGYDQTKQTGVGYFSQTDWSGGSGQATAGDQAKYSSDDGNVDVITTPGSVSLRSTVTTPATAEDFSSTSLRDAAATTATWSAGPGNLELAQTAGTYNPTGTGQSIKLNSVNGLITKATLTAVSQANGQTIVYELSANGGLNFETVTPGIEHTFSSAGSDLRFRISLSTSDTNVTPVVDAVTITPTITTYAASGILTSSTLDTNDATTNYRQVQWDPVSQPSGVGTDSVRFQVAANNDDSTWNYVGPDGTAATYFTTSGVDIPASLDGLRYIRYRVLLQTADVSATPAISFASLGYTSGCVPPGQAFFSGINAQSYNLEVTATGYQDYSSSTAVNGSTKTDVLLTP